MIRARCFLALAAVTFACDSIARDEPLWEAGAGLSVFHFPDYRGSSHERNYFLPLPYVVYRGDVVKADREGLRGKIARTDWLDLNLSLGASLPVHSEDFQNQRDKLDRRFLRPHRQAASPRICNQGSW